MSPWEELRFFQLPTFGSITATSVDPNPGTLIVRANPQRVVLVMQCTSANNAVVGPNENVGQTNSILLQTTTLPLVLNVHDHPGLVQSAWFAWPAPALLTTTVNFMAVAMTDWPRGAEELLIQRLSRLEGELHRLALALEELTGASTKTRA